MRLSAFLVTLTTLANSVIAQVYTDEIPSVVGRSSTTAALSTSNLASTTASTSTVSSISTASTSATLATTINNASPIYLTVGTAVLTIIPSNTISTTTMSAAASSTYSIPFGSTLSNGAYVCNPAHSYAPDLSCDGSGSTPTLVTLSSTTSVVTATMTGNHSATGTMSMPSTLLWSASGTATGWISTWTGAAVANAVPVVGAMVAGVVGLIV